jgi:hypothetical protein
MKTAAPSLEPGALAPEERACRVRRGLLAVSRRPAVRASDAASIPWFPLAHFARWMTRRHRAVGNLTLEDVRRFLDEHLPSCTCPASVYRCRHVMRAALHHLLIVLREAGTRGSGPAPTPIEAELRRFDAALRAERSLAATTRSQRVSIVRRFLREGIGSDLAKLPALATGAWAGKRFAVAKATRTATGSLVGRMRISYFMKPPISAHAAGAGIYKRFTLRVRRV